MELAYIPAVAAFSGSASGALATVLTSWVSQRRTDRARLKSQTNSKREELYKSFIEEASRLYADALIKDDRSFGVGCPVCPHRPDEDSVEPRGYLDGRKGRSVDFGDLPLSEQDIRRLARTTERGGSVAGFQRSLPSRVGIYSMAVMYLMQIGRGPVTAPNPLHRPPEKN
jgi:hypothetical protein